MHDGMSLGATALEDAASGAASLRVRNYDPRRLELQGAGVADFFMPVRESAVDRFFAEFAGAAADRLRTRGVDACRTADALWSTLVYSALDTGNCFQLASLAQSCRAAGEVAVYGGDDSLLTRISHGRRFDSPFAERYLGLTRPRSAFLTWARFARSALRGDDYSRRPPMLVDPQRDILCFAAEPWHRRLAAESGGRLVLSSPENWFEPLDRARTEAIALDEALVEEIVDVASACFAAHGVEMEAHVRASLRAGYAMLARIALAMTASLERSRRRIPRRFWSISVTGVHGRMMARFVQKEGGEVTSFDHGTGCGWMDAPELALMEWDFCDRFVCFSEAHAAAVRGLIARAERYMLNSRRVEPVVSPIPLYDCAIAGANKRVGRDGPPRVWYIPSHYTIERLYVPPLAPDVVALDFQASVLDQLRRMGCKIVTKPHPDCEVGFAEQLRAIANPRVETRSFEEVVSEPDVVILDYPQSTTFRSVMIADVPLVVLDPRRVSFLPEAETKLRSRAELVGIEFDADNRRRVDPARLAEAVANAPALRDDAFRSAYYPIA